MERNRNSVPRAWQGSLCLVALLSPLVGCEPDDARMNRIGDSRQAAQEPGFVVQDVNGVEHRPFTAPGTRALALVFVLTDCPIANSYAPEIRRLCDEFSVHGVAFFLVQVDPDLTAQEARQHAADYGYTCPVVVDRRQALVRRAGVKHVPEAAVFAADGTRVYRGRIDDRYLDYARPRPQPTARDLRDALQATMEGRPAVQPQTEAVGCLVPTLSTEKAKP
jgi:Redoxin